MAASPSYVLFATAVGECGLAWNEAGVCGVWLPETRPGGLRARVVRRLRGAREGEPPAGPAAAVAAIRALLASSWADFSATVLDWSAVPAFNRRVYEITCDIPIGRVLTYAAVAERAGAGTAAQAVGQALGANPFPIIVPCHRVIAANGRLGGFSAPGGTAMKRRLLAIENARLDGPRELFDP